MADATSRAVGSLEDVVAIEEQAPDLYTVVTWSDRHVVDVRDGRCGCADMEYNLEGNGRCKHAWAALAVAGHTETPVPWIVTDDLGERPASDEDAACSACSDDLACFAHFEGGVEVADD